MKVLEFFKNQIQHDLPAFDSLSEGLELILPQIQKQSKSLEDEEIEFRNKKWRELRDDINFVERVLHVFKPDGSYLYIVDGNIYTGKWEFSLGGMIIQMGDRHEFYEIGFYNDDFFILEKNGSALQNKSYLFLSRESIVQQRDWSELIEQLYEMHRGHVQYLYIILVVIAITIMVLFFSFY